MRIQVLLISFLLALFCDGRLAFAQHACQFYAQNPTTISVTDAAIVAREVEIVYTNIGSSTWQNTGGVVNLDYIELRPVGTNGLPIDGPLYHATWINRQRIGSYLASQLGVTPGQRARFVFQVNVDGRALGLGRHDCYFRPYHAQGGYIYDWGNCRITVEVTSAVNPAPGQVPAASIVSVTPANPVSEGATVTMTGTATSNPLEYRWESNGQFIGNSLVLQRGFSAGSYGLRFLARNSYGWGQDATYSLVVQAPTSPPPASPAPIPTVALSPRIVSVTVQRSVMGADPDTGAWIESYDLVRSGGISLRQYEVLSLAGTSMGGSALEYEWSLAQGAVSRQLGLTWNLTTKPDDLFVGRQELRFRIRDQQGNWSNYETMTLDVAVWPRLYLPIHGIWRRTGNNYNEGDHHGERSAGAQDWNHPSGGNSDFGLELVAALSGRVTETGAYSDGGRYANVEHADTVAGYRFRLEYMHMSTVLVRQGEPVVRGQPVGLFGNTGSSSTTTHAHYVVSLWINGRWVSVIPEPCFADDQIVLQVVPYDTQIVSNNRVIPSSWLILPELAVSARNIDVFGYGGQKYWDSTTDARQPTSSCTWDFIVPTDGLWKLWMHNPSAITTDINGRTTHNTTRRAVFEVGRPRVLGLTTYTVDQGAGEKGSLLEVAELDCLAGDRVQVLQHNATGEVGFETTYDELVLTLAGVAGAGGSSGASSPPPLVSVPPTTPSSPPTTSTTSSSNLPPANSPSIPASTPPTTSSYVVKSSRGCALSARGAPKSSPSVLFLVLFVFLVCARRRA